MLYGNEKVGANFNDIKNGMDYTESKINNFIELIKNNPDISIRHSNSIQKISEHINFICNCFEMISTKIDDINKTEKKGI